MFLFLCCKIRDKKYNNVSIYVLCMYTHTSTKYRKSIYALTSSKIKKVHCPQCTLKINFDTLAMTSDVLQSDRNISVSFTFHICSYWDKWHVKSKTSKKQKLLFFRKYVNIRNHSSSYRLAVHESTLCTTWMSRSRSVLHLCASVWIIVTCIVVHEVEQTL